MRKRNLRRVLAAALLLALCLGVLPAAAHAEDLGSIKILSLGNSFSQDADYYLYSVLKSMGYSDIKVGNLYISGCSLATHLDNAKNNTAAYRFELFSTGSNGVKVSTESVTMEEVIKSDSWDFFTFQQASTYSGRPATYDDLPELLGYVKDWAAVSSPNIRYAWHMTWAYAQDYSKTLYTTYYGGDQMTMYSAIVDAVQTKIVGNAAVSADIVKLIPNGTAIQNARTSGLGDNLTRDGYHLGYETGNGVPGRYIAALGFARVLTGREIPANVYAPDNLIGAMQAIAVESVNNAVAHPFEVTQSVYQGAVSETYATAEEAFAAWGLSLDDYAELPLIYVDNTWYNGKTFSTGSPGGSNYQLFISARYDTEWGVTRDALPDGSILFLADGYLYRSDYTDGISDTRPDRVSQTLTVITDSWWNGHTVRGFNISRADKAEISSQYAQADTIFRIFVPKETLTTAAKIGETEYATVADAIAAAGTEPTTVTLCADLKGSVTVPAGKNITIDPDGHAIRGTVRQEAGSSYNGVEAPEGLDEVEFDGSTYSTFVPEEAMAVRQSLTLESGVKLNAAVDDAGYLRYYAYLRWTEDGTEKSTIVDGGWCDSMIVFPLIEKKAKNMVDEHRVTILGIDAAGVAHIARSTTLSIRDYAQTVLEDYINWDIESDNASYPHFYGANLGRLMTAMLSYGAAAQRRFGYALSDQADADLTPEMAAQVAERFGADVLTAARESAVSAAVGDRSLFYGTSCILGEDITLNFYFHLPQEQWSEEEIDALQIHVQSTDDDGEESTMTFSGSILQKNAAPDYRSLTIGTRNEITIGQALAAADIGRLFTVALYRGEELLVQFTDSVVGFTARAKNIETESEIADAVLTYGLAAREYFRPTDQPGGEESETTLIPG